MRDFKVGDKVKWTHVYGRGISGVSMTTWEGTVDQVGDKTVCIKRRKKRYRVVKERVRFLNERNDLTDQTMGDRA